MFSIVPRRSSIDSIKVAVVLLGNVDGDAEEDGAVDVAGVKGGALFNIACSCVVSIDGGWIIFCDLAIPAALVVGTGAFTIAAAAAVEAVVLVADADDF